MERCLCSPFYEGSVPYQWISLKAGRTQALQRFFLPLLIAPRSPVMETQSLPTDLIRPIFQHIQERCTLLSLCLSSKLFHLEAQRFLYFSPLDLAASPSQHINFLTSLLHRPRLAAFVKVYHIILFAGAEKASFCRILQSVLPMMVNLKLLSMLGKSDDLNSLPMEKLVFQLKSVIWVQIGDGDCTKFAHWLDTQKSLKELKWTCKNPVVVSPSACPNLTILEGNLHIITELIPNRPIEQLYGLDLLSLETHSNAAEYRRTLIKGCPSLTTLEFIGDCPQFIYHIPLPPNLRVLILSIRKGYGACTIFPLARCSALVKRLFSESLHLTRVDVAAQLIGNEVSYERWERGIRIQALVSSQEVFQERKILGDK